MTLLILGKDGQVGRALLARRPDATAFGRGEADLADGDRLREIIARERPEVIVNAAAYTAVDAAEDDRERAWAINAAAPGIIGESAREIGALVVHYSTDYVFDGLADGFQTEEQPTSPGSVYGASKLAGEVTLRQSGAAAMIFRTSWVYAATGKNFPLTMLRLARERDTLSVVADQIGAPTSADLIASVTLAAIADPHSGLYHLAPAGETSWHGLATFLLAEAHAAGAVLKAGPADIRPILAKDYPAKAARPANSRLDTEKLRRTFGIELPSWQEGIRQLISTLRTEGRL